MILTGERLLGATKSTLDPWPEPDAASVDLHLERDLLIPAKQFATAPALERVDMPTHLLANLTGRSAHMRRGLYMPGGVVDPGFSGPLELELFNMSGEVQRVQRGEAAARLVFHALHEDVEPYDGRWGDE